MFILRFKPKEILYWANRYPVEDDHKVEKIIAPQVRARGYFTKSEFVDVCRWKTARSKPLVESNSEEFIQAVTQTALSTPDERLRIEVLTLLDGVSWSTASVLLHFGHREPYPILDFRALWALGIDGSAVKYDFSFWWNYSCFYRKQASQSDVTMQTLDRALWQSSKENQQLMNQSVKSIM